MRNFWINIKNRKTSTIFLILGVMVGISILSFDISYTNALKNKDKIVGVKNSDYSFFTALSTKKISALDKNIFSMKNTYISLSIPYYDSYGETKLVGITFDNSNVYSTKVKGSFFSKNQVTSEENLAVIGNKLKKHTYKRNSKSYIKVKDMEFEVIGISENYNDFNSIFLPIKVFTNLNNNEEIYNIKFLAISKNIDEPKVLDIVTRSLENNVKSINLKSSIYTPSSTALILSGIIAISIAIINIINFTVFWVSQRKKEIALRKTVGATDNDIRILLLRELIVLAIIAVVLSLFVQALIYYIVNNLFSLGFYLSISVMNLIISLITAIVIAVISSIPSYVEATKIQPAITLKEE